MHFVFFFFNFDREEHRCKSFKWFMEEIAYDIPVHYPLPPKNVEWGEVFTHTYTLCIETEMHTHKTFLLFSLTSLCLCM